MTDPQLAAGREAAARYLRELLLRPGPLPPALGITRASGPGPAPSITSPWPTCWRITCGIRPARRAARTCCPHQLKDTVGRALSGRLLSRSTLALFVAAFGFSTQEEDRLWRLWRGTGRITVLAGPRAMRSRTVAEVTGVLGPRRHQTVSLHDHVYVGADRKLARTRTMQVVEAIVDGLDSIPYLYDTNAVTLEARARGARAPPGPFRADRRPGVRHRHPADPHARPRRDADPGVLDVLPLPGRPGRPGRAGVPPGGHGHPGELRHADRVPPRPAAAPRSGGRSGTGWKDGCWTRSWSAWTTSTRCTATSGRWSGRWSASTGPGSRPAPCPRLGSVSDAQKAVIACGEAAQVGRGQPRPGPGDVINQALRDMAVPARGAGRRSCSRPTPPTWPTARPLGLGRGLLDRLRLDEARIQDMARRSGCSPTRRSRRDDPGARAARRPSGVGCGWPSAGYRSVSSARTSRRGPT